jgi:cell division control protein 6
MVEVKSNVNAIHAAGIGPAPGAMTGMGAGPKTPLYKVFNQFLEAKPVFTNRDAMNISFTPNSIPHRDKQVEELGRMLAPVLKGGKPSNVFIYGKTGTGKTLVAKYVTAELEKAARGKLKVVYVNCKMKHTADTEYRLLAQLAKEFGRDVPFTGLPTDMIYHAVFEAIDSVEQTVILIVDEIDSLVQKAGDEILYTLTRINGDLKRSKLSLIGITNDLGFIDRLDPRVRSSLGEEEMIFPPYNAVQLQDILKERLSLAANMEAVSDGVVAKCAALAAQEHGDARRALDLLRVSGELAERAGESKILISHVDTAQEKIDQDRVIEITKAQPKQSQAILYAIVQLSEKDKNVETGNVVAVYNKLCNDYGLKPLTQRRVSDLIAELDMFGIIQTQVISKGRYGRTRVINLALSEALREKTKALFKEVFY